MPHPLTAPALGFASRLRFPTLFKLALAAMLVSWLWPFDPLPFIDEIATALAALVLANWRRTEPTAPVAEAGSGNVIEGESRRE